MKSKFRRGQKVVCVHYKDRPVVIVDSVDSKNNQLWVNDPYPRVFASNHWYGPLNWFRKVNKSNG